MERRTRPGHVAPAVVPPTEHLRYARAFQMAAVMERTKPRITREDLVRFIERAAAGAMDPEERSRFLVNHYSGRSMERARAECTRILGRADYHPEYLTPRDIGHLRSVAALCRRTRRQGLNRDERQSRRAADVATFVRQYGRKRQKSHEPNDRRYSRGLELEIKRLDPRQLDTLLREDEEG